MHLKSISANRLRNLQKVELSLPQGLTLVAGSNGAGKTSLLEAVYLLGTGRSFRTRRLEDLIARDSGPLRVVGRVVDRRGETELTVAADKGERQLEVNGALRGIESFLGRLDVIDLTAERMGALRGSPEDRRRFIDRGIVGLDPSHLRTIGEYRRVLQHRNALLRRSAFSGTVGAELDAWDDRWLAAARGLVLERRRYVERLAAEVATIGPDLLPDGQAPLLALQPSPKELGSASEEQLAEVLADRLARCRGRDQELGHTSEGPHRDDLRVELNSFDLRRFGSAGQVRAAMITLKLGKLSLLRKERGEPPVFLMDDFDTDLDETRMGALIDHLKRPGTQSLVATSKVSWLDRATGAKLKVRMIDGAARTA